MSRPVLRIAMLAAVVLLVPLALPAEKPKADTPTLGPVKPPPCEPQPTEPQDPPHPPGPIIIIDPTTLNAGGNHFSIGNPPVPVQADVNRPAGSINQVALGIKALQFEVRLNSGPIKLRRLVARFTGTDGNVHKLEVLLTSLGTLAWKLDDVVQLPYEASPEDLWPGEWCGPIVQGSLEAYRNDNGTPVPANEIKSIKIQADMP